MKKLLNSKLFVSQDCLAEQFESAPFFPHIKIDNFFDMNFCLELAKDFPAFEQGFEKNADGYLNKAYARRVRHDDKIDLCCREDITSMGKSYNDLDNVFSSSAFLELMSSITGIPDLLYDPEYIGGGTHENLQGAQLDPHVDFNYHPTTNWHRRLNIIFFLNDVWDEKWGGQFEVHKDPWDENSNDLISFTPMMNSCVIFATSEHSWHGFNKITLPENKSNLSRKTIALYLYSESRPDAETAPNHSTIYIPRNIPEDIQEGVTLTRKNYEDLKEIFERRNSIIKFLYKREKEFASIIENLKKTLSENIPIVGFIKQIDQSEGLYSDKWVSKKLKFKISPVADTNKIIINGWLPENHESSNISFTVGDSSTEQEVFPGVFSIEFPIPLNTGDNYTISIVSSSIFIPAEINESNDMRELSFKLEDITFI